MPDDRRAIWPCMRQAGDPTMQARRRGLSAEPRQPRCGASTQGRSYRLRAPQTVSDLQEGARVWLRASTRPSVRPAATCRRRLRAEPTAETCLRPSSRRSARSPPPRSRSPSEQGSRLIGQMLAGLMSRWRMPSSMSRLDSARDLYSVPQHFGHRECGRLHPQCVALPRVVLHDDVWPAARCDSGTMNLGYIGMLAELSHRVSFGSHVARIGRQSVRRSAP